MRRTLARGVLTAALLTTAAALAVTVHDDTGRPVTLPHTAQRIVTLAPHATELVVAAGAADRLVAIAAGHTPAGLGDDVPRIGGPGALDRERLLALRPDLVIGWQSGNRAADLAWIARTGIALYRSEPASLSDIAAAIRAIGELGGRASAARTAAASFEQAGSSECARLPPLPAYILVWDHPAMTVGGRHWMNDVLRRAGFRNRFASVHRGVFPIAPEAAMAAREAIVIPLLPRTQAGNEAVLAELLARPGTRLPEAVQHLCGLRLQAGARPAIAPPRHTP